MFLLRSFVFVGPNGDIRFIDPFGGNAGLFANIIGNWLEMHSLLKEFYLNVVKHLHRTRNPFRWSFQLSKLDCKRFNSGKHFTKYNTLKNLRSSDSEKRKLLRL